MTQEEKKSFLKKGYVNTPFSSATPLKFNFTKGRRDNNFGYPNYFNWVERKVVLDPLDQGRCGGCWAFATTTLLEVLFNSTFHTLSLCMIKMRFKKGSN